MSTLLEEGQLAYLRSLAAVTALLGVDQDCRLYPAGGAPDDVGTPYATYRKISGPRDQTHGGSSLVRARLQYTVYAPDYRAAKLAAAALVAAYKDYHGPLGGVARAAAAVDNEIDLPYIAEERYYAVAVDVVLWHSED